MATLTPTLTLTCTDGGSDALAMSVTDSLAVNGDIRRFTMALTVGETELVEDQTIFGTGMNKCYVYLQNKDNTANMTVGVASNDGSGDDALDTTYFHLAAGEFAFFPWDTGGASLVVDTSADGTLEVMLFEATA